MLEFGTVKSLGLGLMLSVATGLAASPAAAQAPAPPATPSEEPAPPADPPPAINLTGAPTIDLSTPEPAAPVDRKFRQHEGFYVRLDVGLGTLLSAKVDVPGDELSSSGLTLNYDLLIGGSPAPGFTIGGGVLGGLQLSGDWEFESGVTGSGDLVTLLIGPFADGFPDSKGGWHFGGLAGLARTAFDAPGDDSDEDAFGFGGAFWGGHDIWVAPEWSVGGLLRLDALRTSKDDVTTTAVGLTLMFTVLYN